MLIQQLATALPVYDFQANENKLSLDTRPLREHQPQYSRDEVLAIGQLVILGLIDGGGGGGGSSANYEAFMPSQQITVDHNVHLCCIPDETKRLHLFLFVIL
jgi:hypothetical protein